MNKNILTSLVYVGLIFAAVAGVYFYYNRKTTAKNTGVTGAGF